MKNIIYLSSGHSTKDPGVVTKYGEERDYNNAIRDALVSLLKGQGFEVKVVPDDLDLRKSINWVNKQAIDLNDGLALEIHCNCCKGEGAESFFYHGSSSSTEIATKLLASYCKHTGFRNRGAKSDVHSAHGSLGWIRKTNCWAILLECGFQDNYQDVKKLKDYKLVAEGIARGVCEIYDKDYIDSGTYTDENLISDIIAVLRKHGADI